MLTNPKHDCIFIFGDQMVKHLGDPSVLPLLPSTVVKQPTPQSAEGRAATSAFFNERELTPFWFPTETHVEPRVLCQEGGLALELGILCSDIDSATICSVFERVTSQPLWQTRMMRSGSSDRHSYLAIRPFLVELIGKEREPHISSISGNS